jgi:glutaredoxin
MQFLREKGVPFEEKDVAANPASMEELLKRTNGVRATPVIVVGDKVLRGFDQAKLSAALGLG